MCNYLFGDNCVSVTRSHKTCHTSFNSNHVNSSTVHCLLLVRAAGVLAVVIETALFTMFALGT